MSLIKSEKIGTLDVRVYDTRAEMGNAAGNDATDVIVALLAKKPEINMIFAAAPSQNETLAALCERKDIDWTRVNAYHMDEYIGLAADAPQRFGTFLKNAFSASCLSVRSTTSTAPEAILKPNAHAMRPCLKK